MIARTSSYKNKTGSVLRLAILILAAVSLNQTGVASNPWDRMDDMHPWYIWDFDTNPDAGSESIPSSELPQWSTTGCWGRVRNAAHSACPITDFHDGNLFLWPLQYSSAPNSELGHGYLASSWGCKEHVSTIWPLPENCETVLTDGTKPYMARNSDAWLWTPSFRNFWGDDIRLRFRYMIPEFGHSSHWFGWQIYDEIQQTYEVVDRWTGATASDWCTTQTMCTKNNWETAEKIFTTDDLPERFMVAFGAVTNNSTNRSGGLYIDDFELAIPWDESPSNESTVDSLSVTLKISSSLADHYDFYFGTANPPVTQGTRICFNNTTGECTRSNLEPNTTYRWQVISKYGHLGGDKYRHRVLSYPFRFTTPALPDQPNQLAYPEQSATGQFTVSWSSVSNITHYELQRSDNGANWATIYDGSGTSHDQSLSSGTYRFRVRACNGASLCSNWRTGSNMTVDIPSAPNRPSEITYPSSSSTGDFTVSWSSVSNVTHYDLQRSADSGTSWTAIYDGSGTSHDQSLSNGTYRFRVRACNGASLCSNRRTGSNMTVDIPSAPNRPSEITYPSSSSTGEFTVSWSSVSNVTHYELQRSANSGTSWATIYDGSGTSHDQSLSNGIYRFRVRACNGASLCSSWRAGSNMTVDIAPDTFVLTLHKMGPGSGAVTSTPSGIDCGPSCDSESASFPQGEMVTLHADASSGSAFGGWSVEDCIGMSSCQIVMTESQDITAFFYQPVGGNVLFDNGMPEENSTGFPSFSERQVSGGSVTWEAADDFILSQQAQVSGVRICGSWASGLTCNAEFSSLRVLFFQDNDGRPADNHFYEEFVQPGCFVHGPDQFHAGKVCYESGVPALNLASNNRLWTVIQPHEPSQQFWAHTSASGSDINGLEAHFRNAGQGGDWRAVSEQFGVGERDISFTLFGAFDHEPEPAWVTAFKDGTGDGVVTSSPAGLLGGIDCGQSCSDQYSAGTEVTLQAQPAGNSEFAFWTSSTGICSGSNPECTFVVGDGPTYTAVAIFNEVQDPPLFHDNFEGEGPSGSVRGINFSGTVSGISGDATWASDMRLDLTSPDGQEFAVGGFGSGAADVSWEFTGSGSSSDGTYTSQHGNAFPAGAEKSGTWVAIFTHTWSGGAAMSWSQVSVSLLDEGGAAVGWLCVPDVQVAPGSPQVIQLQASECDFGAVNTIRNISMTPSSPAQLEIGSEVAVSFDYEMSNSEGFRVWAVAYSQGMPGASQGSPLHPAGEGSLQRVFAVNQERVVDEVRVVATNPDQSETFFETFIPVDYVFGNPNAENLVADGGFEEGSPNPYWNEYSTNFDSPICTLTTCPTWFGPHSGTGWAWFGGHGGEIETGILSQQVTIPSGSSAQLQFQLAIPTTHGTGFLRVSIDDQEVFFVNESDGSAYPTYQPVTVNLEAFADGSLQTLQFESVTQDNGTVNFFLDDVKIIVQ